MTWDPVIPIAWIALAAVLALGSSLWSALRANRRLGPARASLLTLARLLAIAGILALLLQPSKRESFQPPERQRSILAAVDTSASMETADAAGATRFDAAREAVLDELIPAAGETRVGIHLFDRVARATSPTELKSLRGADGEETLIHSSVGRIVAGAHDPPPAALFLFTDGHDFEREPPGATAKLARARDIPIFAVPVGTTATAPDVSLRVASYHPYTFIGQSTRIAASLRVTGFPNQRLVVDLLREGEPVDSKTLETGAQTFLDVGFMVSEEEPGQFEYTMRARPMRGEIETSNNEASTFLNVVEGKLRILEIEGRPYWDSTFLRRSLTRNDKFEVDSLVAFADGGRVRAIRSDVKLADEPLSPPTAVADYQAYHLVLLGREVERVLGEAGLRALEEWVRESEGIVVFTRGRAWEPEVARDLEPIAWGDTARTGVTLDFSSTGSFPPLAILQQARREDARLSFDALPGTSEPKALAIVFGRTFDDQPAIVYRRYGKGQALSLGIANAWRWVFNPHTDFDNNAFDRFWDQTTLWLLANRGLAPLAGFSFNANSANIPVGEPVHLSLNAAGVELPPNPPEVTVSRDGQPITRLAMPAADATSFAASFTPESPGRYRAETTLPDGTRKSLRFIAYRQNLERVETAVDLPYLRALSRASGGEVLEPSEIAATLKRLLIETGRQQPIEQIRPIWPAPSVFLLLVFLLSLDWYLRRKWGLA